MLLQFVHFVFWRNHCIDTLALGTSAKNRCQPCYLVSLTDDTVKSSMILVSLTDHTVKSSMIFLNPDHDGAMLVNMVEDCCILGIPNLPEGKAPHFVVLASESMICL